MGNFLVKWGPLLNSNRFKALVVLVVGIVANDIFKLGVPESSIELITGAVVAGVIGSSLRQTP